MITKNNISKGEVVLYKNRVEVRLDRETVWLDAHQMAKLFGRDRSVILKHIRNIYRTKELDKQSTCAKSARFAADGKLRQMESFNPDVIVSVGYRVNSRKGTQFRVWATSVLRKHPVDGHTLNEQRLKRVEDKYHELQKAVALIGNAALVEGASPEARGIAQVIREYSRALDLLDDFDHERLSQPAGTKKAGFELTCEAARRIIETMKAQFRDSRLMGREERSRIQELSGDDLSGFRMIASSKPAEKEAMIEVILNLTT